MLVFTTTVLSVIAPFLEYQRILFAQNIYDILRYLCHQIPSRCIWIWDSNLGLCSRCFSIFVSFSLCVPLFYMFQGKLKKRYIIYSGTILILPVLIDGILSTVTRYISNNITRSVTGILCGIGFGLIFSIKNRRKVNND